MNSIVRVDRDRDGAERRKERERGKQREEQGEKVRSGWWSEEETGRRNAIRARSKEVVDDSNLS